MTQSKNKFNEAISDFRNKMIWAEKFIHVQPLYYDKNQLFWIWNFERNCYEMADEIEVANKIYTNTKNGDIIDAKERGEIMQSLKQISRIYEPKEVPKSWIQFENGIIDLNDEKMNLISPSPKYFITNPIPHKLGKEDKTPNIDKMFIEWVGEKNSSLLYEILAFCFANEYFIHRFFVLFGDGCNGKSSYEKLVRKLIGVENCASTELDTLLSSRFESARLYKKRACLMGETNYNELTKTNLLKSLCGEDLIGFEHKNKTPFQDYNNAKIIIATNTLPATTDKTTGFYRRPIIIDFPNSFTEKIDIISMIDEGELENLCYKLVNVLKRLLKNREFTNEGTIEEKKQRFEEKSNPFDKFWKDNIEEANNKFVAIRQFEKKLNDFCKKNHYREYSDVEISRKIKEKLIEKNVRQIKFEDNKFHSMKVYLGIKFKFDDLFSYDEKDAISSVIQNTNI